MRRWAFGLLAVLTLASTGFAGTLSDAKATFEYKDVSPFFRRLYEATGGGLPQQNGDELLTLIKVMNVDDEADRVYTVKYDGQETPLHVHVAIDPAATVTLTFSTTPELADRIVQERNALLDERNR